MAYKPKILELAAGGTNASLTADNGGVVYSTASALAIVPHTATANQPLLSGASGAPGWSTATYPGSTTINQILYSSAANTVTGLATANNGTLITGATGVPSWLANGTTGQLLTATTGSPPSWGPPPASTAGKVTGQAFTSTGAFTYTPTANMVTCIIELVGSGGASGGCAGGAGLVASGSGGGGGGSYLRIYATAAQIGASASGSVGTGGTVGSAGNNAGNAGGNTTITIGGGTTWTAAGGSGGGGSTNNAAGFSVAGGAANANTTGTNATLMANITAQKGDVGWGFGSSGIAVGGGGGSPGGPFGQGGLGAKITTSTTSTGNAASGVGGGGGGSAILNSATNITGTAGSNGFCLVTEFLSG